MSVTQLNLRNGATDENINNGGLEQFFIDNNSFSSADGELSTAFGYNTQADGTWAHSEGGNCRAEGNFSHAESFNTHAAGAASHAQNDNTIASGEASHAGGKHSVANGFASTAHGYAVTANLDYQTVVGVNNATSWGDTPDNQGLFVVGNGEYNEQASATQNAHSASNAFVVFQDGHAEVQKVDGNIRTVNGIRVPNNSVASVDWVQNEIEAKLNQMIQILHVDDYPSKATAQIVILYS